MPIIHLKGLTAHQADKKCQGLCISRGCKKKRGALRSVCYMHRQRGRKNTVAYVFNALRGNAKRRGKSFSLTLDQFKEWIAENDYMERRGRSIFSLAIDRVDPSKGYEVGNIQILTSGANIRKRYVDERIARQQMDALSGSADNVEQRFEDFVNTH